MKNTIYFDSRFEAELLENEENPLNSIHIAVNTDANTNQALDVRVGGRVYTFEIESSEAVDFELEDDYWAVGGDTEIRLTNDAFTSEWITITFPELLTTDATLYESEPGVYMLQGQEGKDLSQFKTQIIRYTNTRGYNVGLAPIRVISIDFTCNAQDVSALFTATINFEAQDIEDTAVITARVILNRITDEYFIPAQTVKNGRHVLTITYPIERVAAFSSNNLSLSLTIDHGTIEIEQLQILASVLASGLLESNKWNGYIDIEEEVELFEIPELTPTAAVETISVTVASPASITITETEKTASIHEIEHNESIEEFVTDADILGTMTWQEASAYMWGTLQGSYVWGKSPRN